MKEKKRRQRDFRKVYKTPNEKRQRRLVKERKKKAVLEWDAKHMGMTNANNSYDDEKLLDTFVSEKKFKKKVYLMYHMNI
jgi:hypothetical protein